MSFIPVKEYENDSDSESVDHQLAEFNRLPLITLKNMYRSKTLYYRLDGKITAVRYIFWNFNYLFYLYYILVNELVMIF